MKLSTVLVQLCSQPPFAVSHSLISNKFTQHQNINFTVTCKLHELHYDSMKSRVQLYTCAIKSISFKAFSTCTVEATICVSAVCIGIACMYPQFTLINICKNGRKKRNCVNRSSHSCIDVKTNGTVVITLFLQLNILLTYSCS